ncbi:glycogenin [Dionaea muscipula]
MASTLLEPTSENVVGVSKPACRSVPNRAYVTFLAGNGNYVKGVVGLIKGLRKVKSAYPLIVAVLADVPEDHRRLLESEGCVVREIEPVYPPENGCQYAHAYYVINYSKLRIWEFVEYEKMIYLDGDIQVYENVDQLFDLPDGYLYAVMDCFCEPSWSKTPQYKIGYCQQSPDRVQWPADDQQLGPKPLPYFNAGFFVFEPSLHTYHGLLNAVNETPPTSFAEQDLLNMYFKDIFKPLPIDYNLVLGFLWRHPERVDDLSKVKVVHYCAAGSKPWSYTGTEENMDREDIKMWIKKWWDIYDEEEEKEEDTSSLDSKKPTAAAACSVESTVLSLPPFRAALAEPGAVNLNYNITAPSAA